jgi:5'-methylthioadenosine phosphorylase
MLAVIGGVSSLGFGKVLEKIDVITPYGHATVDHVKVLDEELYFIPRHGESHELPPHRINYKANVYALKKLGTKAILGYYACGAVTKYKPDDLVLLRDYIAFYTPITFFDDFTSGIKHVDVSEPFNRVLCNRVLEAAAVEKVKIKDGGVIATTHGPRYETKAEVVALKRLGANLVSMTSGYETTLANEVEIPMAGIAIATNYACGIGKKPLVHEEFIGKTEKAKFRLEPIIGELLELVDDM